MKQAKPILWLLFVLGMVCVASATISYTITQPSAYNLSSSTTKDFNFTLNSTTSKNFTAFMFLSVAPNNATLKLNATAECLNYTACGFTITPLSVGQWKWQVVVNETSSSNTSLSARWFEIQTGASNQNWSVADDAGNDAFTVDVDNKDAYIMRHLYLNTNAYIGNDLYIGGDITSINTNAINLTEDLQLNNTAKIKIFNPDTTSTANLLWGDTVAGNMYIGMTMVVGQYFLAQDTGRAVLVDMPVSSSAAAGTPEEYILGLDSTNFFGIRAASDGSGSIRNKEIKAYERVNMTINMSLTDEAGISWNCGVSSDGTFKCT